MFKTILFVFVISLMYVFATKELAFIGLLKLATLYTLYVLAGIILIGILIFLIGIFCWILDELYG